MNGVAVRFLFSLQMTHKLKTSSNFVILPPLFYSSEKYLRECSHWCVLLINSEVRIGGDTKFGLHVDLGRRQIMVE